MRVEHLGNRSYWFDEGFCWKMISFPWLEMFARVALDNHGPLFYALLKGWSAAVGDSPWTLRLFSVLMGELTIVGMYLFAREAFRDRDSASGQVMDWGASMGLAVAALTATSAFQIQWSCEVRMYALGTALAAFSSWLLLRALRPGGRNYVYWTLYVFAALAFAYTHNYALFTIAAQVLYAVGRVAAAHRWQLGGAIRDLRFLPLLLAVDALVVGWSPWLPVLLNQRRQVHESFWLPETSWRLVSDTCFQMFAHDQHAVPSEGVSFLAAESCLVGSIILLWGARGAELLIFLLSVLPFALSVVISLIDTKIFHTHHFVFAHLFFMAAVVALIDRLPRPFLRSAAVVVVLGGSLWVYGLYAECRVARADKPGARAASRFLDQRRGSTELAVSCSPMLTPSLEGHSGRDVGWRTYRPQVGYPHYQGTAVVRPDEYVTESELADIRADRIWVIDAERWEKGTYIVPMPADWVPRGEWRFPEIYGDGCEIVVREYAAASGETARR